MGDGRAMRKMTRPLIDLKSYAPGIERIEHPRMPAWCADWPDSVETSGDFDWGAVFRF